jgi:hypothetical protein
MKQMSIAVIALIYGVDAIQIKGAPQPPVAPKWNPRKPGDRSLNSGEKTTVADQGMKEVANWSYGGGLV